MAEQTLRQDVTSEPNERYDLVQDILSLVAEETGTSPMEMSPPLESAVDTDALWKLVERSTTDLRVAFPYQEREIVVESDGEVTISTSRPDR